MIRSLKNRRTRREAKENDLSERLITVLDPTDPASETYRTLRTSLIYALVDTPPKVIVMTSSGPGEGKSTTCANLAVVLSQADKKTLLMDCDLRKPAIHKIFGLRNFIGVVNVLVGERTVEEVCWEPFPGLNVMTAGSMPPNPSELLGSKRFAQLVGHLREQFDYVLIDAPPVELVSDPTILATQGDGVLFVMDPQNTRKGALRQSIRSLEAVGVNILGIVINKAKEGKGGYYRYAYKYGPT
jgi:capsular exopolysaccharide synthesis family protein